MRYQRLSSQVSSKRNFLQIHEHFNDFLFPRLRPHPHNLVGREGCRRGVCTLEINSDDMKMVFSNLGVQCVKRRDIEEALRTREEIRVDPFRSKKILMKFDFQFTFKRLN